MILLITASRLMQDDRLWGAVSIWHDITPLHNLQEQQKALLQMVSHDLRTPLTVIKGHEQVVMPHVGGKRPQWHAAAEPDGHRPGCEPHGIDDSDLVDVTRWEGGQLELQREAVELPRYFDELLRRVSMAMETSRIQVEMPADLPPVCADYARLERILVNLLSNALKYSDPGTPVRLRAWFIPSKVEGQQEGRWW